MQLIRQRTDWPDGVERGAVAIGNFDGVHRGHARIVERLKAAARSVGGPAVVFTFDPHPAWILRPQAAPPPLTWTERKAELLAELGVDYLIAYPTDEQLLSLSAEDFFHQIVVQRLAARALVEGPNFCFGRGRTGTIDLLSRLCAANQMAVEIVEPHSEDGQLVSSSRIRQHLRDGDVAQAAHLLARPYRLRGMVQHGAGRGVKIGFPTVNLGAVDTLLPALGVYAGRAFFGQETRPAAIHLGPNPTFSEGAVKLEAHLLDYQGSLYGAPIEIDFLARLRDIQRFPGPDALKEQLARDVAATRTACQSMSPDGKTA